MSRAVVIISLTSLAFAAALAEVPLESSGTACGSNDAGAVAASQSQVCKESDQNVLFQGKMQVVKLQDSDEATEAEAPGGDLLAIASTLPQRMHLKIPEVAEVEKAEMPAIVPALPPKGEDAAMPAKSPDLPAKSPASPPKSPIEKFAMAPGVALKHAADRAAGASAPKGWFLVPAMGSIFILLMQCTDVHADSYGMEEEWQEDTTRPPRRTDRLPLFDIARFGLLVGVIWTQLLLAFGNDIVASSLHEFVWPSWFFLAGIFGSSLTYESVTRVVCYTATTNFLLACIGASLAFFNYRDADKPVAFHDFCGGAWVLWCLLLYRLTITPLSHAAKALHIPGVLFVVLIHIGSYASRLQMPPSWATIDVHAHQVEHLLLMVKTVEATIYSALLNAPYFATGLLLSPIQWNGLLTSVWFGCVVVANGVLWFVLTVTPLLYSLMSWQAPERPWGIKFLMHADTTAGGFFEDAACFFNRLSAVLVVLYLLFVCASLLQRCAPTLASYVGGCGGRIRYTLALFVLWYMIRPCILSPPHLPFHRFLGMTDAAMCGPALFIALVVTSAGTSQLFRWIIEPYWSKCCLEWFLGHLTTWPDIESDKAVSHKFSLSAVPLSQAS